MECFIDFVLSIYNKNANLTNTFFNTVQGQEHVKFYTIDVNLTLCLLQ